VDFVDYGVNYSRIFNDISPNHLDSLQIDCEEKKIPFNPVITVKPSRIAFVGLNAYCGDDYLEAFQQPNFTVWCQSRYNTKIFNVMDMYLKQVTSSYMKNGGLYFTDFVKIVLPASHFIQESGVIALLGSSSELGDLFQSLLKGEIETLMSESCRLYICFGNKATDYLRETLSNQLDINCEEISDRIMEFRYREQVCYLINERHYSYYSRKLTSQLITNLNSCLN